MKDSEVSLSFYSACIQIRELDPVWSVPFSHTCAHAHAPMHTHTHTCTDIKELKKLQRSEFRNG